MTVIDYAEKHGKRPAARHFGIDESNVRLWCTKKDELKKCREVKKHPALGRHSFPNWKNVYWNMLPTCVARVSTVQGRIKAKVFAKESGITDFQASRNWCYRFMERHNISIRRRTHISQKLPEDHADRLVEFQQFIIKKRTLLKPPLSLIGNADQTPLAFDLLSDTTLYIFEPPAMKRIISRLC